MGEITVKITTTDVDIDTSDRNKVLELFEYTNASIVKNKTYKKHNTGVYFHQVPINPYNNLCSIDYEEAEKNGFFKIDILNVNIYKDIKSEEHLLKLMNTEPIWELLEEEEFCDILFHMKGHHSVCKKMKPKSVTQLAAVLAMIRPSKRYLIGKDWNTVFSEIWEKPKDNSYYFKKSHAHSYSIAVVVHMNLLCEQLI
jgi:DNA polymerase III alpha subunit